MFARMVFRSTVLFFCITVPFLLPAAAQIIIPPGATDTGLGGVNTITGMVLSSSGQRIQRRIAIRLKTMTRGDRIAMTDDYGNFAFRGLVSGDYVIVIEKESGFEPYSQGVSIVQVRGFPAQNYNLSIRLKPKPSEEARPAVVNAEFAHVPKKALEFYDKAIELAKAGDHKSAIQQLLLAVNEYPEFMLAYNEMGVQYLRLNELAQADEALQSALRIEPEAYTPLLNRAIVLFHLKRFADSEPILRTALKAKPDSAVAHYFLGQVLANSGHFEEAVTELTTALDLDEEKTNEGRRVLAIIYSSKGERKKAADELEKYLKAAPAAPDSEKLKAKIKQLRAQ